jgi:protoporphyrinogen/coproporphyrinogen III oxidase
VKGNERRSVAVIGGGISGLACAHRLSEVAPELDVTVLEGAQRTGGLIATTERDGCLVELGPDSILTEKPAALDLIHRLGLDSEVIGTREHPRGAYVVARGRLEKIPDGFSMMAPIRFGPVLSSPILSPLGKLRMLSEMLLPRGPGGDESVGRFVRRRFGSEVLERIAQPLMGGIYGADVELLSLGSTMPRFLALEAKHGSVTRGLRRPAGNGGGSPGTNTASRDNGSTGARYGLFVSFKRGVQSVVDALTQKLGNQIRTGHEVRAVQRLGDGRFALELGDRTSHEFDAVVLALPARPMARVLDGLDRELAERLLDIPYGSTAAVTLCLERAHVPHALDAFGFVVPKRERRRIIASTWASVKFEGRAPLGTALLRVFFGGDGNDEVLELDDEKLVRVAREELGALLGIQAPPRWEHVARHPHAMPKYLLGHEGRKAAIERRVRRHPLLELAGNALYGVGIPDAVKSGEHAAERVVAGFARPL